jgi:hypothetical protein
MFTSKLNVTAPWDRSDFVALILAVFITIGGFALKLRHSTISATQVTSSCMSSLIQMKCIFFAAGFQCSRAYHCTRWQPWLTSCYKSSRLARIVSEG